MYKRQVFARGGEIQFIFCDSAEQTLINHIRARLRRCKLSWLADRVENSAKIRINDRIRLTCILMGGGRFWLLPEAATLRDALATALYSGKHPGVDERLDDGSTDVYKRQPCTCPQTLPLLGRFYPGRHRMVQSRS